MIVAENLFQEILLAPANAGADELLIVSGFATASMAHRHMEELAQLGSRVQLVYGMAPTAGVSLADDAMFKHLESGGRFNCHYRIEQPPVHSKVYVWMSEGVPRKAYVGSANYTQAGFFGTHQEEAMAEADPDRALAYFQSILRGSLEIGHEDVGEHVTLFTPEKREKVGGDCVKLPLVTRSGEPGVRSGLNWGKRPGRNPNQAYLPVPSTIAQSNFFPRRATRFTVLTDDGFSFIAVAAQDNAKAIHTPDGNNILGEYFRRRLRVVLGQRVRGSDLRAYGRTDVEFCKLDNETYFMDFSV